MSLLRASLLLALLAVPARAGEPRLVILWTHPTPDELAQVAALERRGWLPSRGFRVIGVYHAAEWGAAEYRDAQRTRGLSGLRDLEIQALDCPLADGDVRAENACSEQLRRLFERSDGLVLAGGPDIPPALYGQPTRLTTAIQDPPRHRFELSLLHHLLVGGPGRTAWLEARPAYAILGLCLGMQTLQVGLGGELVQDIPSQLYGLDTLEQLKAQPEDRRHRSGEAQRNPAPEVGWGVTHPIRLLPGAPADELAQAALGRAPPVEVQVLSLHHQAVARPAAALRTWATSLDGRVVEGVVHTRFPSVWGVQFHPEKDAPWEPGRIYRAREGAPEANALYLRLGRDERSRAFHQAFWARFVRALEASARTRPAPRPPGRR